MGIMAQCSPVCEAERSTGTEMGSTILVTGGCGFIGSNFIHYLARICPGCRIVNLDALTYAGNLANLNGLPQGTDLHFVKGDVSVSKDVEKAFVAAGGAPDFVVNFAAESHVDRSVLGPRDFVKTNVTGTLHLLEALRAMGSGRFIQISTDEVYGSLGDTGRFVETTPLSPSSPYSASKAGADLLVQAYHRTFGMDTVITRCSNNYGPRQFPEKLIPLMIINALAGKPMPVYGEGRNVRDWIHVDDHCAGIKAVMDRGRPGQVYNFGGDAERRNLDIVYAIADSVCAHRRLVTFVKDRPGHDWRYAMDAAKARRDLSWTPSVSFDAGLSDTIKWYIENETWWRPVLTGDYLRFYKEWYGDSGTREARSEQA